LPKRGFGNGAFKKTYAIINLADLEKLDADAHVNEEFLRGKGLLKGSVDGVKILGRGELTKKLTVEAEKFSESARQKIEQAGGAVVVRA
jgi:large subunit ribosomal protein L15